MTKTVLTSKDVRQIMLGEHSKFTVVEKNYDYFDETRDSFNFDIVFKSEDNKYFKGKVTSFNTKGAQRFHPISEEFERVYPKKREIEVTEWTIK